ncbi:hypothetical protein GCM10023187_05230 [Nibrella viscosa]|uniref:Uncharacterized protein n=1 Tax=Nibrella viscosa TaxID=1084524 RepID=A0ABP8JWA8_9BACT
MVSIADVLVSEQDRQSLFWLVKTKVYYWVCIPGAQNGTRILLDAGSEQAQGIVPDIQPDRSVQDLIDQRDVDMEATHKLIQNARTADSQTKSDKLR